KQVVGSAQARSDLVSKSKREGIVADIAPERGDMFIFETQSEANAQSRDDAPLILEIVILHGAASSAAGANVVYLVIAILSRLIAQSGAWEVAVPEYAHETLARIGFQNVVDCLGYAPACFEVVSSEGPEEST